MKPDILAEGLTLEVSKSKHHGKKIITQVDDLREPEVLKQPKRTKFNDD
jgi:hypothetical protein